jgi:hypothetical protein
MPTNTTWLRRLSSGAMDEVAYHAYGQERRSRASKRNASKARFANALMRRKNARTHRPTRRSKWGKWRAMQLPGWRHKFLVRHRGSEEQIIRMPKSIRKAYLKPYPHHSSGSSVRTPSLHRSPSIHTPSLHRGSPSIHTPSFHRGTPSASPVILVVNARTQSPKQQRRRQLRRIKTS